MSPDFHAQNESREQLGSILDSIQNVFSPSIANGDWDTSRGRPRYFLSFR